MKSALKNILWACAYYLGLNAIFRARHKDRIRVLMYHGVAKSEFDPPQWAQLNIDAFVWQMRYVQKHFSSMPVSGIGEGSYPGKSVVITFDDGLQNVFENALPVLRELYLKAVCFVLPGLSEEKKCIWPNRVFEIFVNTSHESIDLTEFSLPRYDIKAADKISKARYAHELTTRLKSFSHNARNRVLQYLEDKCGGLDLRHYADFRLMTMDKIKTLSESAEFEIGLHTNTHPILSTQTRDEQSAEISGCRKKLDDAGIKYICMFAYPNGRNQDFNDDSVAILKENGIKAAFTTEDGFFNPGDDLFHIKRIPVGADMGRFEFAARLSGFYYFMRSLIGR